MAITADGVEVAHRLNLATEVNLFRGPLRPSNLQAFEIHSRTTSFADSMTHYRRNKATPSDAFGLAHQSDLATSFARLPPIQKIFAPAILIEIVTRPSLVGDNTIEIVYNIPNRLRVRPRLLAPPNGSQDRLGSPVMRWTPTSEAVYYEVHIALDDQFVQRVARYNVFFPEAQRGFAFGATYYWRVRAVAGTAWSDWSEVWSFRVPGLAPAAVPSHPGDGGDLLLEQFKRSA